MAIGADPEGHFQALIHTGTVAKTQHNGLPEPFILPARCLYAADNLRLDVQAVELDMLANTFLRAPGEAVGSFALECAIDELAERIGIDPVELRIRNEPETDPTSGKAFSSRHLVEAFRAGAERFGWANRDPSPGARREGEWLTGMGCATATYPYHRFSGGVARITLTKDGHVDWSRSPRTKWAWAPPPPRPRSRPNDWACRSSRCPSPTATRRIPASSWPGDRIRPPRSAAR